MRVDSRWPSWLAVAIAAVIALLSVGAGVVTMRVANEQEHQLLDGETQLAAQLMRNEVYNLYAPMSPVATAERLAHSDPEQFDSISFPVNTVRGASIVLLQREGTNYVVVAGVGPATDRGGQLAPGNALGGSLAVEIAAAGGNVRPTEVVRMGGGSTFGFALGPGPRGTSAGYAVYEQLSIPLRFSSTSNGPFNSINFALYGSRTADPRHLVLDNTSALPLRGNTVHASVSVGTATWLAVGSAKGPLSGSLARSTGWIILGLGLLIAVLVGVMFDALTRRRRYAEVQVALRTAELAQSVAHLEEAQAALVQRERLAAVGQMASVVGHELRNPLTAVTNALYLVRATLGTDDDTATTHLELAEREVNRAATLAQDLTDFVRPRRPVPEPFGVDQLLEEVMQASPPPPNVSVRARVGRLIVVADRVQVGELLTNLITNAYQALSEGGQIWVWAEPAGSQVRIAVQDDGPGIDPDVAERMFEPFVTTKTRGTGLGLAIVARIAEEHGGSVFAEPLQGRGTRIVATLPGTPEQNDVAHQRSDEATGVWTGTEEGGTVRSMVKPTEGAALP